MRRDSLPIQAVEEPRRARIPGVVHEPLTCRRDDVRLMARSTPAGTLPSAERIAPLKYTPRVGSPG